MYGSLILRGLTWGTKSQERWCQYISHLLILIPITGLYKLKNWIEKKLCSRQKFMDY